VLYNRPMVRAHALGALCLLPVVLAGACERVEARNLAREGNELYRAGRIAEALGRFEAAARLDPDFPTLQLHIGYAAMSLAASSDRAGSARHASRATAAFARYMELAPEDERGPRYYLQVLLDSNRFAEALRFLEDQQRKSPNDVMIVSSLGAVSSRAGNFAAALRWYERRAELLRGEAKARYLIGTLCWEHLYKNSAVVGAERVKVADRGIRALEEAVRLQPGYGEAVTYINLLYRERAKGEDDPAARERDLEQARRHYERALELMKSGPSRVGGTKRAGGSKQIEKR